MQNLIITTPNQVTAHTPEAINNTAKKLILNSKSKNTVLAYKKHVNYFCVWCKNNGIDFCVTYGDTVTVDGLHTVTPANIANYVSYLVDSEKTASTIVATIAAINSVTTPFDYAPAKAHLVKTVIEGAKRTIGVAPQKAKALNPKELIYKLHTIKEHYQNEATQLRNTAMLLLGFAGAFRRSELVALKVSDFKLVGSDKATFFIARSKTDQLGAGAVKPIKRSSVKQACAIAAVEKWIQFAGLKKDDFIFTSIHKSGKIQQKPLSPKDVNLVVKTVLGADFSAHSLRSGFITEGFNKGYNVKVIQQTTLQKTDAVTNSYNQVEKMNSTIDIFG